jgi:hypothetical protein
MSTANAPQRQASNCLMNVYVRQTSPNSIDLLGLSVPFLLLSTLLRLPL